MNYEFSIIKRTLGIKFEFDPITFCMTLVRTVFAWSLIAFNYNYLNRIEPWENNLYSLKSDVLIDPYEYTNKRYDSETFSAVL